MSSKIGSLQVTERKIGLVHWSKKVGETENGLVFFYIEDSNVLVSDSFLSRTL